MGVKEGGAMRDMIAMHIILISLIIMLMIVMIVTIVMIMSIMIRFSIGVEAPTRGSASDGSETEGILSHASTPSSTLISQDGF